MASEKRDPLLSMIGARVRRLRRARGCTVQALADASGLSARFVSQLEAGDANIAVGRLARVAAALESPLEELVRGEDSVDGGPRAAIGRILTGRSGAELAGVLRLVEMTFADEDRASVSLLGLRGAGKSSVGVRLAEQLGLEFLELDEAIQDSAGLQLAEIFAIHGEAYYGQLQGRCLARALGEGRRRVIALPGGIVQNEEAFALALRHTTTIWLSAPAEAHMERVLAQGDTRPVADREDAMAELRAILDRRTPMYRRAAITVETSARTIDEVVATALGELGRHGWSVTA